MDQQTPPEKNKKLNSTAQQESKIDLQINRGPGRPKLKQAQRKKTPLPHQVSSFTKAKMMKAAAVLQKGRYIVHIICV